MDFIDRYINNQQAEEPDPEIERVFYEKARQCFFINSIRNKDIFAFPSDSVRSAIYKLELTQ